MAVSKEPHFVSGVWGPYYSAMVPCYWLNEGGQSATGKLIDHLIDSHPASITAKQQAAVELNTTCALANYATEAMRRSGSDCTHLELILFIVTNKERWKSCERQTLLALSRANEQDHKKKSHDDDKSLSREERLEVVQKHIQTYLGLTLESMAKREKLPSVTMLTKNVHLWPDFHGNRSPIADPSLKGMEKPPPVHPSEIRTSDLPFLSSRAQHDKRVSQLRHRGGLLH
uniref:Carbohydrate kinase FGGY C-terminal domain-containing protein n=1 Tax=Timema douglasi TaxID=61478 RepID=A0A7R8VLN6_TIMDO|nr:unnamed protein product [Timema douglasi]